MKDSCPKVDVSKVDALLIDELVSGQLTGERYRATLRALDAEPAKWRDCALAFLEEQALRNDLRILAQGTINWSEEERTGVAGDLSVEPSVEDEEPSSSQLSNSPSAIEFASLHPQHVWSGRFRTMLSTAALLMVSFTVGWLGSEVIAERGRSAGLPQSNQITQNLEKTSLPTSPRNEPEFFLDDSVAFDRGIPDSIRQLERDGRLTVQTFDMLVPTKLKDGSPAYLPVQQMILGPGSVVDY